jgi:hypothetical protein
MIQPPLPILSKKLLSQFLQFCLKNTSSYESGYPLAATL